MLMTDADTYIEYENENENILEDNDDYNQTSESAGYTGYDRDSFKFHSIAEVLSNHKTIKWLVKDVLDSNSLAQIFGEAGTWKTFIAIDMGMSIATWLDWHGKKVTQGTVFYIPGEGLSGIGKRLKAWTKAKGADNE